MSTYATYDPSANPKQTLFHSIKPYQGNLIKAAIGALSGGKSTACEQEQVLRCLQTPYGTSIASRFSLTDTGPTLLKDYQAILRGVATWMESKSKFVFPNGHELFVVPAKKFDRFGSQELVTFYIQEAQEAPWEVFDALSQRLRHKAGLVDGVPMWCGMFDARGIDTRHWIYEKFINNAWNATTTPESKRGNANNPAWAWVQFSTTDNPHQRPGYIKGLYDAHRNDQKWIRVFLQGEVGTAVEGSAVFEEFDPGVHVGKIEEDLSLPMLRGVDFGYRHPAVVWAQRLRDGRFVVLRELTPSKIRRDDLASEVESLQMEEFPQRDKGGYLDFGDVAGDQEGTATTTEIEFWESRFSTSIATVKKFLKNGHEIMRDLMSRMRKVNGVMRPCFMVDESCRTLITALGGGYCFKKRDDGTEYVDKDNVYKDVVDATRFICQLITDDAVYGSEYEAGNSGLGEMMVAKY